MGLTKFLVQMKLPKEQEASKERKDKKRANNERKEKRDKSKDDISSSKHKEHGHKKRKHEERHEILCKNGLQKGASKEVIEQLEKSGLTEEHELTYMIPEPCESSESTHNSLKSRKVEVHNVSDDSYGKKLSQYLLH